MMWPGHGQYMDSGQVGISGVREVVTDTKTDRNGKKGEREKKLEEKCHMSGVTCQV